MTRLLATIRWDVQLQIRNGFYYAAAFVAIVFGGILISLSLTQATLTILLPAILFENMLINTFYFVSALVLLEKGEGTIEGLIVTPLRQSEYLISKLLTLSLLSLVEGVAFTLLVYGFDFNLLWLIVSMLLLGALYTLWGFIVVIRYDSINSFLFPSFLITSIVSIPLLEHFDLWSSWILYVHPLQAPLVLMRAAFQPVPTWQLVYGMGYAAVWIGIVYLWSHRAFHRFVITKEGVKG